MKQAYLILLTTCLFSVVTTFVSGFYTGIAGVFFSAIIVGLVANIVGHYVRLNRSAYAIFFLVSLVTSAVGCYLAAIFNMGGSITFPTGFMAITGIITGVIAFTIGWSLGHYALKQDREPSSYQAILVFAFGDSKFSNRNLIRKLGHHAARGRQVYTQQSIYRLLPKKIQEKCHVLPQEKEKISTYEVAIAFREEMEKIGWQDILIIAADKHIKRCRRDMIKAGFNVRSVGEKTIFDRHDPLWWTRNKLFWWVRESILRTLPFWMYKRVTG